MVAIEGEAMRPVTWVVVEEVRSGDWGIAGKPLTTQDVRARVAGRPSALISRAARYGRTPGAATFTCRSSRVCVPSFT